MLNIRRFYLSCCFIVSPFLLAQTNSDHQNLPYDFIFGSDLYLSYGQQQQAVDDATRSSLLFSPYMMINSSAGSAWTLGVDLPWESVDGAYSYNVPAQLNQFCERLNSGQPIRIRRQSLIDNLTQLCNSLSNTNYSDNGIGDISLFLQHTLPLSSAGRWLLSSGVIYKLDNADYDNYLGSGTQDLTVNLHLSGDLQTVALGLHGGKNFIMGGDLEELYDDYLYVGATIGTPWQQRFQLMLGWEFQDLANENLHKWQLTSDFELSDWSSIGISYQYYDSDSYFVDAEITAELVFHF